ncbi:hypothetical protein ACFL1A_02920, partial [Patescibacteria group bacterium]
IMSEETKTTENDSSIYYVLGGVVLVAAVAGFFLLKPKDKSMTSPETPAVVTQEVPAPTPGPITKFDCGKMYYNPVVGFPKYFLSLEGVDVETSGDVNCTYTISVKDKVVASAEVTAPLTEEPSRGGATFRCSTEAIELAKGIATDVEVTSVNPNGEEVSCTQSFVFP